MKTISKTSFAIISTVCAIAFTSCKDSADDLLSFSESETYKLQNPSVTITPGRYSATVEIAFAYPVVDETTSGLDLAYWTGNDPAYIATYHATCVSKTPTKYIYELKDLDVDTEYSIGYPYGKITYLLDDSVKCTTTVNLPPVIVATETIYTSPIAVEGGFDTDWTAFIPSQNAKSPWYSVRDESTNQLYGGVGYAACHNMENGYKKQCWLVSPSFFLEEGQEYIFCYYGRATETHSRPDDASSIRVIVTWGYGDIILTEYMDRWHDTTFDSTTYSYREFRFTAPRSRTYWCSFYPLTCYTDVCLTGFKIKRIKY